LLGNKKIIEITKQKLEKKGFISLFEEPESLFYEEIKEWKRID